jgi:hypothetical protein
VLIAIALVGLIAGAATWALGRIDLAIFAGMAMSGIAMAFAADGYLPPIAGALIQEVIDIAVILNALRALTTGLSVGRRNMPASAVTTLRFDHDRMATTLNRLREIADALDNATSKEAVALIKEADRITLSRDS